MFAVVVHLRMRAQTRSRHRDCLSTRELSVKEKNAPKDVDITLTAVFCILTGFCLFSLYT